MNSTPNSLGIAVSRRTLLDRSARLALGFTAFGGFHINVRGEDGKKL